MSRTNVMGDTGRVGTEFAGTTAIDAPQISTTKRPRGHSTTTKAAGSFLNGQLEVCSRVGAPSEDRWFLFSPPQTPASVVIKSQAVIMNDSR
ncbi:hypothetical protein KQX54_007326 [Cotesia glomerata]|uniref:Uncharacterized protein n=1 Tax=Cotesia glomerata TaxID=32391 RepID=A0AAV7J7F0_COTGL|nr:hypothetical protein KQX54_007326 [Cotesia glomerata]